MTTGTNPEISFAYGNMLRVNKKKLWADVLPVPDTTKLEIVTPEQFGMVLEIARIAIQTVHRQMPEVWSLRLSTDADTHGRESRKIYTPQGYDKGNGNSGLTEKDDIVESFHSYWEIAEDAQFIPKVMGASGKVDGGAWLLLRNTSDND